MSASQRQNVSMNLLFLSCAIMLMFFANAPEFQLGWNSWWDWEYTYSTLRCASRQNDAVVEESHSFRDLQCEKPQYFPKMIELSRQDYENWSREIHIKDMWTAFPQTQEEVIQIANWAVDNGYTLRPIGYKHSWSPTTVTHDQPSCGKVVLIDTTKHLTKMKMVSTKALAAVQVGPGTSLDNLLTFLDDHGFGIGSHPATGDISIGGIIAVGGHGAGLSVPGYPRGSLSNLVISLNACVWNEANRSFEIRTFNRTNLETKYLLVNLGRIFLTELTLRVIPKLSMRCTSHMDIPANELFENPKILSELTPTTFDKLLTHSTSVELLWYVSTSKPWIRIWNIESTKPSSSKHVSMAYNYPFTDSWPQQLYNLVERTLTSNWHSLTPVLGKIGHLVGTIFVPADIWGTSKNVLLHVKSTTARVSELGYAVITSRQNLQLVLSQFTEFYTNLTEWYADQNLYPVSIAVHIRVSGLDMPGDVGIKNAEPPALSVLKPEPGRPDLDTALWISLPTFRNTPNLTNFMIKMENFLITNYPPSLAIVRPEWSKSWAYSNGSAWTNNEIMKIIPNLYNSTGDWSLAISTFDKLDPKRVFTNTFINLLFH